jgi:hypothetical protein
MKIFIINIVKLKFNENKIGPKNFICIEGINLINLIYEKIHLKIKFSY